VVVPLAFASGEICQFDWSHEHVELVGVMQTIKVTRFLLRFSRQMFVATCQRETQEMVFDAHNQATLAKVSAYVASGVPKEGFAFCGDVPRAHGQRQPQGSGRSDLHRQRNGCSISASW
jgi:hypothetical protein